MDVALKQLGAADLAALIADGDAKAVIAAGLIPVKSRIALFNGVTWDDARSAVVLDVGLQTGLLAAHSSLVANVAGVFSSVNSLSHASSRSVSAVNTAQAVTLDLRDIHDTLAISSVGSAGTHTLTVEGSVDNVNFITLDSIAAVLTQIKQYTAATVGATVALSPLAFRYVRITSGTAGVGNTTTLTIAAK